VPGFRPMVTVSAELLGIPLIRINHQWHTGMTSFEKYNNFFTRTKSYLLIHFDRIPGSAWPFFIRRGVITDVIIKPIVIFLPFICVINGFIDFDVNFFFEFLKTWLEYKMDVK
jgi:hypothetical protein